jgi:hypothetical protein
MSNRFINPNPQFLDDNPNVYEGGSLSFYLTGTTTPADTFADNLLLVANPNPLTLDASGRSPVSIWLDPAVTYKVILKDSAGVTVWTRDPVIDPAANAVASVQVYPGNPNGNLAGNQGAVGGSGASLAWDITTNLLYVCTTTGTAATAVWTQVAASLAGAVSMTGVLSPTSLAADQNDYNPTGLGSAAIIRQDAAADVRITGLAGGTAGRLMTIENVAATSKITLAASDTASLAANRFLIDGDMAIFPGQSVQLWYDAVSSIWRLNGAFPNQPAQAPGGRLTIETGKPVLTASVIGASTVYYSPSENGYANLYNGVAWYTVPFSELSQTLADTTKSPAASIASTVYDMFLWNDAGTLRCTRGPAWASATSRGTGAGTSELVRVHGTHVNAADIVNGPAAQRGLYVGSIATDSSNQLNMHIDTISAAGGGNARIDVWNRYNRAIIGVQCRPSDDSWTQAVTATWRRANASSDNRITFVNGLELDAVSSDILALASNSGGNTARIAIGLDSIDTPQAYHGIADLTSAFAAQLIARYSGNPGLGRHFLQWLEYTDAGTTTWYGDNGASGDSRAGMTLNWMA